MPDRKVAHSQVNPAPDFKLRDIDQRTVVLINYRDKQPVVLFFWTTWCPYCRKELKTLNDIYPELVKEGIEVLAVNIGEPATRVGRFTKTYPLAYRVLLDEDSAVAGDYELIGVPTYILIDRKGYIVFKDNYFPKEKYRSLIGE
jgi:peroxiredoxin